VIKVITKQFEREWMGSIRGKNREYSIVITDSGRIFAESYVMKTLNGIKTIILFRNHKRVAEIQLSKVLAVTYGYDKESE